MSRHEGDFTAAQAVPIKASELESLFAGRAVLPVSRSAAIAAFLSAEGGWEDAGKALGGAFADGAAGPAWLSADKD